MTRTEAIDLVTELRDDAGYYSVGEIECGIACLDFLSTVDLQSVVRHFDGVILGRTRKQYREQLRTGVMQLHFDSRRVAGILAS